MPVLDRGQIETRCGHRSGEGKHQVLMPGDFPVGRRCLVEGDGLDGDGSFAQETGFDQFRTEGDGRSSPNWSF